MKNSPKTKAKTNKLRAYWKATIDLTTVPKTTKRVCKICGEYKDCGWNYTFSQTGKPEYRNKCIDCFKIYAASIRNKHRKHISKNHRDKNRIRKQKAVDYFGGKCKICNYDKSLSALTFHHRNKNEKEYAVCTILDWSWEKILKELDKCDLLCFNCHMELHDKENNGSL